MRATLSLKGRVRLTLRRVGKVVHEESGDNIVTTVGKEKYAAVIEGDSPPTLPSHMATGDGVAPADESDTALGNENADPPRAAITDSVSGNEVTYACQFTCGTGSQDVSEIGIFNAASVGDLYARFLTSAFTMQSSDTLDVSWVLEVG